MEITLRKNGTWASSRLSRDLRITCREGLAWVTRTGDSRDVILRRGESFTAPGRGRIVVWALEPARVDVESAEPAAAEEWSSISWTPRRI